MVDVRTKAIQFIEQLKQNDLEQIRDTNLKTAYCEYLNTLDRRKMPLFITYLRNTGLIKQVNDDNQNPIYQINYERQEQLRNPNFQWLNVNAKTPDQIKTLLANPENPSNWEKD